MGGILRDEHETSARIEREADQIASCHHCLGRSRPVEMQAVDRIPPRHGVDHEEVPLVVERQTLRTPEPIGRSDRARPASAP
jgi:hypothetical protein